MRTPPYLVLRTAWKYQSRSKVVDEFSIIGIRNFHHFQQITLSKIGWFPYPLKLPLYWWAPLVTHFFFISAVSVTLQCLGLSVPGIRRGCQSFESVRRTGKEENVCMQWSQNTTKDASHVWEPHSGIRHINIPRPGNATSRPRVRELIPDRGTSRGQEKGWIFYGIIANTDLITPPPWYLLPPGKVDIYQRGAQQP